MYRQPISRAAAAFSSPFLVAGDTRVQHIDILNTNRITGSHYGGDIVRIEYILQHNHQSFLPFIQHRTYS
jgi:hypothetical protein